MLASFWPVLMIRDDYHPAGCGSLPVAMILFILIAWCSVVTLSEYQCQYEITQTAGTDAAVGTVVMLWHHA